MDQWINQLSGAIPGCGGEDRRPLGGGLEQRRVPGRLPFWGQGGGGRWEGGGYVADTHAQCRSHGRFQDPPPIPSESRGEMSQGKGSQIEEVVQLRSHRGGAICGNGTVGRGSSQGCGWILKKKGEKNGGDDSNTDAKKGPCLHAC